MKILLVCESFSAKLSGGKVVRFLLKILRMHGHDVQVAVTSPLDGTEDPVPDDNLGGVSAISSNTRYYARLYAVANASAVPEAFVRLLDGFRPDIVHFASFDHTKSVSLYRACLARPCRVVLQPWTMHFFCAQGFGFRADRVCTQCISSGFSAAISEGCTTLRGCVGQIERAAMHRTVAPAAHAILSSNRDLDTVLSAYGFPSERVHRFPVAFDASLTAPADDGEGDYFAYYGQMNSHKGSDVLLDTFRRLPDKQLRCYPMNPFTPSKPLPPNVQIIPGLGWDSGLRDAIAGSRAVVVPSQWMTSTEYTLCEAMCMRKPVVAFDIGAHKELLIHGQNAMVVPAWDLEGFKAALCALDDRQLARRIGHAGAARIAAINKPETLHANLLAAYGAAMQ